MRRVLLLIALLSLARAGAAPAGAPWQHPLTLSGGGYWTERVPITLRNAGHAPVAGEPVPVEVAALAGSRIESLRLTNAAGQELLFDVRDGNGRLKHTGALAAGDRLIVPAECDAGGTTTLYVYAGNDAALAEPDFLPTGLVNPGTGPAASASAGPVERLTLVLEPAAQSGFSQEWPYRATLRVMNLTPQPANQALVFADLRSVRARLSRLRPDAAVNVIDAVTGRPISPCLRVRDGVLFAASVPAHSIREYRLFFSETAREPANAFLSGYRNLVESPLNLAPNGSFEAGGARPEQWTCTAEAGSKAFTAKVAADGRFGRHSAEFSVAPGAKLDWVGWRSAQIPIEPGATYFYSGFLKSRALAGSAVMHAHLHARDGKLVASGAFVSTGPGVSGDSPWTQTSTFLHAPADAASVQLHLTMNSRGTLQHDGVLLCRVLPGEVTRVDSAETAQTASGLRVWEVNPLVKVFPDSLPGAPVRQVAVECARGELEPFQLVLRSDTPAEASGVRVTVSPLKNAKGASLPPVRVERVGYVPVDHPSGYFHSDLPPWYRRVPQSQGATDGWAGDWPDPLIPGGRCELTAGRAQPVWFTVSVPRRADPGDYEGQVLVQAAGQPAVAIPVHASVLPFALPERPSLKVIFDLRSGSYGDILTGPDRDESQRKWLRFMADHWLGTDHIPAQPRFTYENGKVSMDAAEFDRMAHFCLDELGMSVSYTPRFFYAFGWAYPPKKFFGLEPFTPEYNDAFKQAVKLFSDHLKEKGWHDRFVYYISDEPHFDKPAVVAQMQRLCALAHEADPTLPIYSSTWRHCPEWDQSLDIWGVGQYGCFPVAEMQRLRKQGKQMWLTCDGQMAIDTPYLATERMLPYYCYKYGATGFEFWGLSWWTFDPWERGWHKYIRQSNEGTKYFWIRYPNGDGYLAYPGGRVGVDGPVSSIRLEEVRQGLEDYEALRILESLTERARHEGRWTGEAEQALAMARELVTIPNAGGLRSTEILPDPDRLPAARKAVNAAIVHLWR